jgi:hypothetical protein
MNPKPPNKFAVMKTIFSICGLVLIFSLFGIIIVWRSKKLGTLVKVGLIILLFLLFFSALMVPIVLLIAKARGVIH